MVIKCDFSLDRFKQELKNVCNPNCGRAILYAVIFLTVLLHLFFEGFSCSCDPQKQTVACNVHLILPSFIIMLLLLRLDRSFRRALFRVAQTCSRRRGTGEKLWRNSPLLIMIVQLLRALTVSLVWVVSVLLNGSWWVCCRVEGKAMEVPCRDASGLTPSEKSTIAHLKSLSRASALGVLLAVVILAAVVSVIRMFFVTDMKLSEVIWNDGQNLVFEMVRTAANQRIKEDVEGFIGRDEWSECSNAVEDFIKKLQTPKRHLSLTQDPPEAGTSAESSTAPPQETSSKSSACITQEGVVLSQLSLQQDSTVA